MFIGRVNKRVFWVAALLTIAVMLVWYVGYRSGPQVDDEGVGVGADQEIALTPILRYDYQSGELRSVGWTQSLYENPPPNYTGEFDLWSSGFHIHDNDVVMIMGSSQLRNESIGEQWYWPVCVLQGGIYPEVDHPDDCASEENWYWVPDDGTTLFGPITPRERSIPPFSVGEEVRVSYNFCLRTAPAGPYTTEPCIYAYGGRDVTIISGPTFADGRYWCEIRKENGTTGWVSCEFAKK